MKHAYAFHATVFLLLGYPGAADLAIGASPPFPKPNILLIIADDLGYGDVQCLNPQRGRIPTPHLDRLATQGMTFTDAHSGSSVCTPTRYGLLTGRYAWRTRLQAGVLDGGNDEPLIAALTRIRLIATLTATLDCLETQRARRNSEGHAKALRREEAGRNIGAGRDRQRNEGKRIAGKRMSFCFQFSVGENEKRQRKSFAGVSGLERGPCRRNNRCVRLNGQRTVEIRRSRSRPCRRSSRLPDPRSSVEFHRPSCSGSRDA